MDLAAQPSSTPVALKTIAERNDISLQFLEHIFASFRRTGIVKSVKGSQGGYNLAKAADEITVASVVEALEGSYHSKMRMLWRKTAYKGNLRYDSEAGGGYRQSGTRSDSVKLDFGTNERILFRSLRKTGNVLYLKNSGGLRRCPGLRFFLSTSRGNTHMSIKKIAEKAGVSISTVSRILNRPDYKCSIPGLREKVWAIAMEMNYVPNEAARNLKKGRQSRDSRIWYVNVLMTRTDESRTDPFFTELLRVVESEIHEHNCILSKV